MATPYRPQPSTELAPRAVPLSFWQRVKPTLRFGAPTIAVLALGSVRFWRRGQFVAGAVDCAIVLTVSLVVLAFWSEPYRTWRQRRVLAKAKELSDRLERSERASSKANEARSTT
jgi:hypothetical protein